MQRRNSGGIGCFGGGRLLDDELGPGPGTALTDSASDSEPVMPAGLVGIRNLGESGGNLVGIRNLGESGGNQESGVSLVGIRNLGESGGKLVGIRNLV